MENQFMMHFHLVDPLAPLEALSLFAEWCETLGPGFELYEHRAPGDIVYDSDYAFSDAVGSRLLKKCKISEGYYFPIGCKQKSSRESHYAISTRLHWSIPKNGRGRISFNLEIQEKEIYLRFVSKKGISGILSHLGWIIDRVDVNSAYAGLTGSRRSKAYQTEDKKDRSWARMAIPDALDFVEWITFYNNRVIDKYGRDLLMSGSWYQTLEISKGTFFVADENLIDWNNDDQCEKVRKILKEIKFHERFDEQTENFGQKNRSGTIIFYPEDDKTIYEQDI